MKKLTLFLILAGITFTFSFGQLKMHANGNISVGTLSMPTNSDLMLIKGGIKKGIRLEVAQNFDWGQSMSCQVSRQKTVSYVVRWNNTDNFYVFGDGQIYAKSAWFYSDSTLKENIQPLKSSLEKVMALNGVSFDYKKPAKCDSCEITSAGIEYDRSRTLGLIAQEVEKIVPEAVATSNTGLKLVSYDQMIPLLVEAIKEQNLKIEELEKQIESMKGRK